MAGGKRKLDYQKKDFSNPFFRKQKNINYKKWFFICLILIIIFLGVRFVVRADIFLIKNVEINGNKNISSADIKNLVDQQKKSHKFFVIPQDNIIFFDTERLEETIENNYILDDLKIAKDYFHTIKIQLTEAVTSIVWLTKNKSFYIDLDGQVISDVKVIGNGEDSDESINILRNRAIEENLPIIFDDKDSQLKAGDIVLNNDIVSFIIDLNKALDEKNIVVRYYQISPDNKNEIWAKVLEGYNIYFSTELGIIEQVNNLNALLDEKIKNPTEIEYIDLRFGKKVFYK